MSEKDSSQQLKDKIEAFVRDAIERAHQTGFIELEELARIMARDTSYDETIFQLSKKYHCKIPESRDIFFMWIRLLNRWVSGAYDGNTFARATMARMPAIRLIPFYQHDYKTGAFLKRDPISLYDDVDKPYINLEEFKEFLTTCDKIPPPAALFAEKPNSPIAESEKPKNLRNDQKDKKKCQLVASGVWDRYPSLKIKYMKAHPAIMKITGRLYKDKTVHEWLSEVAPDDIKKPGRISNEELKRQRHICDELGIKGPE